MRNIDSYYEYYTEKSPEDAETLVFVPGVSAGAFLFKDALEIFQKHYKVLLLNNPGVGGAPMMWTMSVDKLSQKFIDILDHLEIEKAHLVGHSMGGMVTQTMALLQPNRFDKLVLMSTSYGGVFTEEDTQRIATAVKSKKPKFNVERCHQILAELSVGEKFRQEKKEEYEKFFKFYLKNTCKDLYIARHFLCGGTFSSYGRVHLLPHDVLVVHGNEDELIHIDGGKKLAGQIQGARLYIIPHCGHVPFLEVSGVWNKVLAFLQGKNVGKAIQQSMPPALKEIRNRSRLTRMMKSLFKGFMK